jgi:hypothetical protein
MDDRIQQGRDPEWRLAFEDRLDEAGALPAVFGWFWVAVLLVLMVVVPVALRRRRYAARQALEANQQLARRSA